MRFLIRKRQFEAVHALLGISWPPDILTEMLPQTPAYIGARDKYIIRSCTSLGNHKPAKLQLEDHVINRYLPRKIANYLGIAVSSVTGDTVIRIASPYTPNEGKIKVTLAL